MNQARLTETWTESDGAAAGPADDAAPAVAEREAPAARPVGPTIAAAVLAVLALGWIALFTWSRIGGQADVAAIAGDVALGCVPLALLTGLWLVLRGGDALRFGGNAAQVAAETRALDAALGGLAARLEADRALLADHGRTIAAARAEADGQLAESGAALQADAALLARERQALEYAAAAARADLATLLEGLPRAGERAEAIGRTLRAAGEDADRRVLALGQAVALLSARAREADETAGGAADRMNDRLRRIEQSGQAAAGALDSLSGTMGRTIDEAMTHAAEMIEHGRAGIDAQAAAMRALVEQARATLARAGVDTSDAIEARLAAALGQVDAIGQRLTAQDAAARDLIGGLNAGLRAIEGRFADLGQTGAAEGARLAATVQAVAAYAEQVREGLVVGGDAADALVGRAEALAQRLEAPARQLHETLPDALARLEQQARRSLSALGEAGPQLAVLESGTAGVAERMEGIAGALAAQMEASGAIVAEIDRQLAATAGAARALDGAIGEAGAHAARVAEGSTSTLIDAMVRVRETATQAAGRAREAIAAVIPDSAAALARASEAAIARATTRTVDAQIARLAEMAEGASDVAGRAADRLAAQVRALAESTDAVEDRLAVAREAEEERARDSFPRRAAHLIDALNSAAIDVAKILSNEVTDTVWAAYLKGDRGVFTRRAVRLLDNSEQKEILRHYGEDPEFRDQVNRYVHDFEALLRPVLGSRDGAPLAVTLLGSDMGKLYVALAQAISRLRG